MFLRYSLAVLLLPLFASAEDGAPLRFIQLGGLNFLGNARYKNLMQFQKVEWEMDNFVGESDWGVVTIDQSKLDTSGVGAFDDPSDWYMNILRPGPNKEALWVVDNLMLKSQQSSCAAGSPGGETTLLTRYFSLEGLDASQDDPTKGPPTSTGVRGGKNKLAEIDLIVLISPFPVPLLPEALLEMARYPTAPFPLTSVAIDAQGHILVDANNNPIDPPPGNVGPAPQPLTIESLRARPGPNPTVPGPSNTLVAPVCAFQEDSPNVQCARNQCVPMAVANTLQFLEDKYGKGPFFEWELGDDHVLPGYGKTADNFTWAPQIQESFLPTRSSSLIAEIDALTRRRNTDSFDTGRGSTYCQLYDGMFGYLDTQGLEAEFRHQGADSVFGFGGSCSDPSHGGRNSTRVGAQPTWQWMYDELQDGNGVFLAYGRYNSSGIRTGGHVLRVQGACRFASADYLYLLDDGRQGSTSDRLTTGLQVTQWRVEDTRSPNDPMTGNGQLNLDGANWEIEWAQAVRPILKPRVNNFLQQP
mmetsp:Transcript_8838/g.24471  ORF Transcript_8838/g.24471 Transcript_8838/m.24471 type:complete len:528 (+) Transcript_8838:68-1651(+)